MKVSELLLLDCREEENMEKIIKGLKRLPFFSDKKIIKLTELEKALRKMSDKYSIMLCYIMPSFKDDGTYYSFMIKRKNDNEWLGTITSHNIYEGFAKSVLFVYKYIKDHKEKE